MSIHTNEVVTADVVLSYFDTLSNWGRWGGDDRLGTLNLITPEVRVAAGRLVETGTVVSLSRDIDPAAADPLGSGLSVVQRHMGLGEVSHILGRNVSRADATTEFVGIAAHGSNTHLDGLAHYDWDGRTYNGYSAEETITSLGGSSKLSIHDASHGIVTRGVLLDIAGLHGMPWLTPGHAITPDELHAAESEQGVALRSGDAMLLHTGHVARNLAEGPDPSRQPGLHASCLPWLRERDIAALGSDAIQDVQPSGFDGADLFRPVHTVGLVAMGLWLIDNMEITELAAVCARARRWEFFFAMLPWRMVGVTSSATNPVAIF